MIRALAAEGCQIRRRRECICCGERFTTFESYEVVMPRVIKSDGKNEPFDEAKLRRSLLNALQKRPVTQEQIETVLSDIQLQIRRLGERDVKSRTIGEIVMQALFALDHVAYVRFCIGLSRFPRCGSISSSNRTNATPRSVSERYRNTHNMSELSPQTKYGCNVRLHLAQLGQY